MSGKLTLKQMKLLEGKEIGLSDWFPVTQDRILAFAECTEDRNWIHLDQERAAKSPLKSTVAHGFLLLSLLPHFNYQLEQLSGKYRMAVNYGLNRVRFISPVRSETKIRCRSVLKEVTKRGFRKVLICIENTLEVEGEERPALVAEFLALIYL